MIRVGFAGLGRMGIPMATNIVDAGFELGVWNRTGSKAHALAAQLEAAVHRSPRELAEATDVVLTMLASDAASEEVHRGRDGLFAAVGGASVFLVMGTHSPRHIAALARDAGDRLVVDAPVSGSTDAATAGRLMIMIGAEPDAIASAVPVLETVGSDLLWFGVRGAATTMKLAVNLLIHGLNQSVAESLALAQAAGIDRTKAFEVLERSAAAAPMLSYRKPQYLRERESSVSFALSLARKDLGLALEVANNVGVRMPQAEVNLRQLRAAEDAGFGERDMAALVAYTGGEG